MEIVFKKQENLFHQLEIGQSFVYNKKIYIKISGDSWIDGKYNSVDLGNGTLVNFANGTQIDCPNVKVVVEQ